MSHSGSDHGDDILSDGDDASDAHCIPECEGIPRKLWVTKPVTLYNCSGIPVAEGICHSVSCDLVIGCDGPLGDSQVAVQITKSLSEVDVPDEWRYSVRAWPIEHTFCRGASLRDHEIRYNFDAHHLSLQQATSSTRAYSSSVRSAPPVTCVKAKGLLSQESINGVSSYVCCSKNCLQPFPRDKIRIFRQRMYCDTTFKFRSHLKLDVHRQVHRASDGRRVVTVEGVDVCMSAWRHIAGVSEATFHRFKCQALGGCTAQVHGNTAKNKIQRHTEQATATLRCILEKNADHMPHRSRTLKSGEKVVSMILPATWKWKEAIPEINHSNSAFGLKSVSASSVSRIRREIFPEFDAKRPGDNFARCSTCDKLHSLRKTVTSGSDLASRLASKLNLHLASAAAHRAVYYANRYHSSSVPEECLTVIHDKMDHAKTACPVVSHKSKATDGFMKLPISVTGMIAHGHGDVRYAHYGIDVFAHDSNYTVGSFAKLLRDLEAPPVFSSRELFLESGSASIFKAILKGSEKCKSSLRAPPSSPVLGSMLPPILHVHMDNATADNKNRYVFSYWSLLVAKRVFREIYVHFMLVGHTHDDIDALFGRWSMVLKKEDFPTLPLLMKSFMDLESVPVIPHLVEEVPDYKSFVHGYLLDGSEALIGHTKAQEFKFYVDATNSPVMKYKVLCTHSEWLPKESGIQLWRKDTEGQIILPFGSPSALVPRTMRALDDIEKGLFGFINYWEKISFEDQTGESRRRFDPFIHYWKGVLLTLREPLTMSTSLRTLFWPRSRIIPLMEDHFDSDGEVREEFASDEVYVGPSSSRPHQSFRVGRDVYEGYFVAVRPAEGDSRPVWIARALTDPNCSVEHPNSIYIQYFRPTSRKESVQSQYSGWDSTTGLRWKVDEMQDPVWELTTSLMTAWKSRIRKGTLECTLRIPSAQIEVIHGSLHSFMDT